MHILMSILDKWRIIITIVLIVEKNMELDIEIIDYRWTLNLLITVCYIFFFLSFSRMQVQCLSNIIMVGIHNKNIPIIMFNTCEILIALSKKYKVKKNGPVFS